ncbi:25120_t:CDS:2, partial [Racocetra persica]
LLNSINLPATAGEIIPKLRKLQAQFIGLKDLNLILDVKTRWNSTHNMLTRSLELRKALDAVASLDKDLQSLKLDHNVWNKIQEVANILKIFLRVIQIISLAKYPLLASTIPIYNYLIKELELYHNNLDLSYEVTIAINMGLKKLKTYYSKTNDLAIYTIAVMLDPWLKL